MYSTRRFSSQNNDFWSGYVDVLASVLMVIIFVLMTFMASQFFLSDALNDKNEVVNHLNKQLGCLSKSLQEEAQARSQSDIKANDLQNAIHALKNKMNTLNASLSEKDEALLSAETGQKQKDTTIEELSQKLTSLNDDLQKLTQHLAIEKKRDEEQNTQITSLKQSIQQLNEKFEKEQTLYAQQIKDFDIQNKTLQKELDKTKTGIMAYRSAFFTKLIEAVGNRSDVRVVGDRFVFQSEVLFSLGSDKLGGEGKKQLDTLVDALKDITKKMPSNILWILRVDGHTDQLPIKKAKFKNNWHLSTSRAVAVVEYLIQKGISPKHLAATGFGEFQPIEEGSKNAAKNRRIEFKLDAR
jgi:chemotaxis protein MotB